MDSEKNTITETLKEEIYKIISELVEEQVYETVESVKGDLEDFIRMIFSLEIKLEKFDQNTQERISSLQEVFTNFKNKLKEEILEEIMQSEFKNDLINEMKKELMIHMNGKGGIPLSSISRKKVILAKPRSKTKTKTKKPAKG